LVAAEEKQDLAEIQQYKEILQLLREMMFDFYNY